MAKYKKKRARELQHDKFRDTAGKVFDRVTDRLEGRGKALLYGLVGVIVLAVLIGFWLNWRQRKADEAQRALGRAIAIASTPVTNPLNPPPVSPTAPTFSSEQERAQKAIEEFEKVAAKYGDPYRSEARYFIAVNLLYSDREKGVGRLMEMSKSDVPEVSVLSTFALAQAKEADGKHDEAAQLYMQLAQKNSTLITPETANLRLASVYEKQGKKKEAIDLLFNIVQPSRTAKDSDGRPLPPSVAAREASDKLQKLDPDRYAKLTPEAPTADLPF
ncbi:MAG: tetratricopeptide repeat protein [Pyrinomonadaceae bacterium]